jgi:hypothetical protein
MPFHHCQLKYSLKKFIQQIEKFSLHANSYYIYHDQWLNNQKHGYGRLTIRLNHGSMQRYETLYLNQSIYYEGEFLDNKRSGWG